MYLEYHGWLTFLALALVASGSLFQAVYGLLNLKTINSSAYSAIDGTTPEIQRARRLSKFGLRFLGARLVLQVVAQVCEISFA